MAKKQKMFLLMNLQNKHYTGLQRWSPRGRPWPRGHILKSLALASKVKSLALASRPQFCGALEKFFGKRFLVEIAGKIFVKTFFFFFEIA